MSFGNRDEMQEPATVSLNVMCRGPPHPPVRTMKSSSVADCIRRKAQCSRPKGVPSAAAARAAQNAADAETKNDEKNTEEDRGRNGQVNVPGRVGEDDDERRWGRFLDATRKRRTQLLSRRSWFGFGRRGRTDDRPAVSTFDMCRIRARRVARTKISCCPLLAWSR
jgi:hypothetical protein